MKKIFKIGGGVLLAGLTAISPIFPVNAEPTKIDNLQPFNERMYDNEFVVKKIDQDGDSVEGAEFLLSANLLLQRSSHHNSKLKFKVTNGKLTVEELFFVSKIINNDRKNPDRDFLKNLYLTEVEFSKLVTSDGKEIPITNANEVQL